MTRPRTDLDETPALLGGTPMVREEAPAWPFVDEGDRAALLAVLESRVWGGYHPEVAALEQQFAALHGAEYGLATANGTVSLEIALTAAGVQAGDEVIVPPITFIASASAILRVGAVPVFVDVDRETLNLSPPAVSAAITPHTRAVVAVHFAGHPVDLDAIGEICAARGLTLIEDSAHAPGAAWRGRPVGTVGAFGSFSFQASKNLTSGEGGMLIATSAELAERARSLSNQGRRTGGAWYEHVNLGTNARLTGFQATLLRRQLDRLPEQTRLRAARAERLRAGLRELSCLTPLPAALDARVTTHAYHLFCMRYDPARCHGLSRDRFVEALRAEGVPATTGYPQPIYRNELFHSRPHIVHPCPVAESYCRESVWLPHNALLASESWIDDVLRAMGKVERTASLLSAPTGV